MVETRRRRRPKTDVSNQYYVGYVEDDESVDAIMKKFEELERIEQEFSAKKKGVAEASGSSMPGTPGSIANGTAANAALGSEAADTDTKSKEGTTGTDSELADAESMTGEEGGMTMELLEEVFKRTSAFTVRGAMIDALDLEVMDDVELWEAEAGNAIPLEWEEEEDYITLHLDDDALDDEFGVLVSRRRMPKREPAKRTGAKLSSRDQIIQRYKYMQVRIQDRHGHTFFVSRKVNAVDPSLPTYVRIPPAPISRSWVKHIRPLADTAESTPYSVISGILIPKSEPKWARRLETDDTLSFDFSIFGCTLQCVYMDPPLLLPNEQPRPGYFDISRLRVIPVHKMLVPGAFLFTWCEKELLPDMCEIAEKEWGLKYVENFCWVRQLTNNHIARLPSDYFCRSKVTLMIFRKGGDLEMRHQRSPDSVFDFVKPRMPGDLNDRKPDFSYTVIETLLPRALCTPELPDPDRLVQLWMPADNHRTNWTTIVQTPLESLPV
ncbi:hypothetical protein BX661DRAFT_175648 [Kickxella alabastrina]|uniref:uncharacterized protein n=1 Tax=Kickxella alabastrina TaxID=61397 RepID=UPI00221FF8B5|nr:uncharacterized protein BX661DRAFT_175648 [Kickxella alabastrina]KAI7834852.1 hypothetical protein BX661DRAFT_175648 [Kickxella alabastrina]KAJ1947152.1 hypothetical protein GGF37_000673 [Kickxella alabastrina]